MLLRHLTALWPFQHEIKMRTVQETIKDADSRKRHLEDNLDQLNEEVAKLKAQGEYQRSYTFPWLVVFWGTIEHSSCYYVKFVLIAFCHSFSEQLYLSQLEEREKEKSTKLASADEMRDALQKQMDSHREQHQKQLNELRKEIAEKQDRIDQMTEYVAFSTNAVAALSRNWYLSLSFN